MNIVSISKFCLKHLPRHRALSPLVILRAHIRDRIRFSDHPWIRKSKWPVRSATYRLPSHPFFIIGNPRSGTTLLRCILSYHPEVFIPPENSQLGKMIQAFGDNRGYSWRAVVAAVLEKFGRGNAFEYWGLDLEEMQRAAEALPAEEQTLAGLINMIYLRYGSIYTPEKKRWGDKYAGNAPYLKRIDLVFPEAIYIHIVRDVRDSIISNVNAGFSRNYINAAHTWKNNVRSCHWFGNKIHSQNRFFEFRYEDLVSTPEKTVSAVCHYLGLEPTEAMLHYQGASNHHQDVFAVPHHQNVTKPIFCDSIGKWKTQLPKSELSAVLKLTRKELALFGYE